MPHLAFIPQNVQKYSLFFFISFMCLTFGASIKQTSLLRAETFLWVSSKQSHQYCSLHEFEVIYARWFWHQGLCLNSAKYRLKKTLHDIIKRLNRREYSQTCTMTRCKETCKDIHSGERTVACFLHTICTVVPHKHALFDEH